MSAITTGVGEFLVVCMSWLRSFLGMITAHPVLLIFVLGFSVIGFGIGLLSRLFRVN